MAFAVAARLWQLVAATVTVILMRKCFSEASQGYYYTIVSLLAVQTFLDLGLGSILLLLTSHEWKDLELKEGSLIGKLESLQRLSEIYRFGCRWYRCCALGFAALMIPTGIVVLSKGEPWTTQQWVLPWVICVVVNSLSLTLLPCISVLEGCNQVSAVYRMRLWQSVVGSFSVWVTMATGFGLWTLVVSNVARLLCEVTLVLIEYRSTLSRLSRVGTGNRVDWKKEIWPLQWRLAIQSVFGYFATWFMVPVIFRFQGDAQAGRIGMTWQLLTTIQAASMSWIQTRLPRLGALLSANMRCTLDSEMRKSAFVSCVAYIFAVSGFFLCLEISESIGLDLASRFTSTETTWLFAGGILGWNICLAEQHYVRLFKKDPFLFLSVISSCLVGSATWYFGATSGAFGVSTAFFVISWIYAVPASTYVLLRHQSAVDTNYNVD